MSVTHSDSLHEFYTSSTNQITVIVRDELEFSVDVEKGEQGIPMLTNNSFSYVRDKLLKYLCLYYNSI